MFLGRNGKILGYGGSFIKYGNEPIPPIPPEPPEPEELKLYDFNSIDKVYQTLKSGDKVAFIIRHSERNDYYDERTGQQELTDAGIQYARETGKLLKGGIAQINDISLHSTDVNRTRDTAYNIAIGRGDFNITVEYTETNEALKGSIYVEQKPYTGWEDYSLIAYDLPTQYGGVFKDIPTISQGILDYIKNNMKKTLNIFVTHDQLLEILTVYVTNKNISLRFWDDAINDGIYERRWITYLAGLSIIERSNGTYEIYPVRSLDKGFQRDYDNIYYPG